MKDIIKTKPFGLGCLTGHIVTVVLGLTAAGVTFAIKKAQTKKLNAATKVENSEE